MAVTRQMREAAVRSSARAVAELRIQAGLSLREASRRLGERGVPTHHSSIRSWELGEFLPDERRLREYARILRVSRDRLEAIFLDARRAAALEVA